MQWHSDKIRRRLCPESPPNDYYPQGWRSSNFCRLDLNTVSDKELPLSSSCAGQERLLRSISADLNLTCAISPIRRALEAPVRPRDGIPYWCARQEGRRVVHRFGQRIMLFKSVTPVDALVACFARQEPGPSLRRDARQALDEPCPSLWYIPSFSCLINTMDDTIHPYWLDFSGSPRGQMSLPTISSIRQGVKSFPF